MQIFNKFLFFILIFFLIACSNNDTQKKQDTILVSLDLYSFFVKKIISNNVKVESIIPSNIDPHTYEPTFSDIKKLLNAKIWIRIGENFEEKIFQIILEKNPTIKILDLRDNIELIPTCTKCSHHKDQYDKHIWLSPKLMKKQCQNISTLLIKIYPKKSKIIETNLEKILLDLDKLESSITQTLKKTKSRLFLTSHSAFKYFCIDFNFEEVEIASNNHNLKLIEKTLKYVKEKKIQTIIIQNQHNNKGAEIIAQKLNLQPKIFDPYSLNYFDNMLLLAKILSHEFSSN